MIPFVGHEEEEEKDWISDAVMVPITLLVKLNREESREREAKAGV